MITTKLRRIAILAIVGISAAALFWLLCTNYFLRDLFEEDSLSREYPLTTDLLHNFYDAWEREDWIAMESVPFGNLDADFYELELTEKKLSGHTIVRAQKLDEYRVMFQVVLTINSVDTLVYPKVRWDGIDDQWKIIDHEWDLNNTDFAIEPIKNNISSNQSLMIVCSIGVFLLIFLCGMPFIVK